MSKKAIIIGGGVGGLATAIRLLNKGYQVKIFEKEETLGGRVNLLETEDFKFDLTASILLTPEIYKEIFIELGKDYKDYLEFIRIDPIYKVNYYDGSILEFSSDLVKLTKTLEKISTEDSQGYIQFLAEVYKKYLIAEKYFLQKSFRDISDFVNFTSMIKGLQLKTFSNTYDFVSKYIKDEKLRQFLCFQSLYVGISPYEGPNIYSLIPTMSQLHGLWHLKGGMYSYVRALEQLIVELGGDIKLCSEVKEIVVSNGNAIGVKTEEGVEKSDLVVCNGDFPYAMKELIKDEEWKGKYNDEKIQDMKYSCSVFMIYLGLQKKYPELSLHNHFIGEDFKENIQAAFTGKLPKNPSLYIYCPSRVDDTRAKAGQECISIVIRVPNLLSNDIEWNGNTIKKMRKRTLQSLKKIKGLEDIEENIIYENYLTPKDLETRFYSYGGTAFGLSPTLSQTNYFRPNPKSPTVKNLYFVGSSIHPGSGVSVVLTSSKLATEEVLKDDKK